MNKNLMLTATVLALSLSWMGCNKSGKLSEASTFKTPAGAVELKLKWPQGERIVQDMEMKQSMEFAIPGQPAPMKQNMTMGQEYGLTVLKESPDGGHEVEMEFLNAKMGMTMGSKKMLDYDSSKKSTADKADPAADVFGKIVGAKIRYFLDANNEVVRLEGIDELAKRLTSGAHSEAMMPIKSMFSEEYFKRMMSQNRFMPTKPVQPGDTWPVKLDFPMGKMGTLTTDYTFTFKSWEMHGQRNCARLEFDGTLKSKPDPNPNPAGMTISGLDGTTSGVSWFDPDLGIIIDTTMNQDMTMVMNMNLGGKKSASGAMHSITNQMTQLMTIKLASVK